MQTKEGLQEMLNVLNQRKDALPALKTALEAEAEKVKEKLNTLAQETEEV